METFCGALRGQGGALSADADGGRAGRETVARVVGLATALRLAAETHARVTRLGDRLVAGSVARRSGRRGGRRGWVVW
jgi:hypothetical protein